ncbi:MAG: protease inhibitor I9 family protein, partial [Actinomycetota bacterium]
MRMPRPGWKVGIVLGSTVAVLACIVPAAAARATGATRTYIVVLNPVVASETVAAEHATRFGAKIGHVYRHALRGYSGRLSAAAVAAIRADARVAWVELDGVMLANTTQS